MKTLTDMYSAELAKQPENNPALSDILFLSAFPNVAVKKKSKELARFSEDLFEDFNDQWKKRVEDGIRDCLKENMGIQLIIAAVPFLTRDEFKTLLAKVDEFLPGDTDEMAALRVSELQQQYNNFAITAQEILKELFTTHMQLKAQSQIKVAPASALQALDGTPLS